MKDYILLALTIIGLLDFWQPLNPIKTSRNILGALICVMASFAISIPFGLTITLLVLATYK